MALPSTISRLTRLWRRVTHIGVRPGLPATEAKYVIVNNTLVVLMTMVGFITLGLSYAPIAATQEPWLLLLVFIQLPLMLLSLVFAGRGHHFLAALWFGLSAAGLLIFQTWMIGMDSGIHLYMFLHAVLPFGTFPPRYGRGILIPSMIYLLMFLAVLLGAPAQPAIDVGPGMRQILGVVNPLFVFLSLAMFGYHERSNTLAAELEVEQERQRAEHLLLNILPAEIAERLKRDASAIAATARKLQATHALEDRGLSVIKGKGELQTYWLTGHRAAED